MTSSGRRRRAIVGLSGPTTLWLTVTVILPLAAMLAFSLLTVVPVGGREASFTLKHYADVLTRPLYLTNTWRSVRLGLDVTAVCALIGYPAAFILARTIRGRWREALLLLVVLPFWSNSLVRTFSWTMVLNDNGLLSRAVHALLPFAPSFDLLYTYSAIVIGLVQAYLPYMILTCYISLQAIDDSLVEAASSLGASRLAVFRRVVLPLSLPGLAAGSVLTFVPVMGSFMEPRILGGQQAIMLGTLIENQFTASFNWGLGAALGFVMLLIVALLMAAFYPVLKKHLAVD